MKQFLISAALILTFASTICFSQDSSTRFLDNGVYTLSTPKKIHGLYYQHWSGVPLQITAEFRKNNIDFEKIRGCNYSDRTLRIHASDNETLQQIERLIATVPKSEISQNSPIVQHREKDKVWQVPTAFIEKLGDVIFVLPKGASITLKNNCQLEMKSGIREDIDKMDQLVKSYIKDHGTTQQTEVQIRENKNKGAEITLSNGIIQSKMENGSIPSRNWRGVPFSAIKKLREIGISNENRASISYDRGILTIYASRAKLAEARSIIEQLQEKVPHSQKISSKRSIKCWRISSELFYSLPDSITFSPTTHISQISNALLKIEGTEKEIEQVDQLVAEHIKQHGKAEATHLPTLRRKWILPALDAEKRELLMTMIREVKSRRFDGNISAGDSLENFSLDITETDEYIEEVEEIIKKFKKKHFTIQTRTWRHIGLPFFNKCTQQKDIPDNSVELLRQALIKVVPTCRCLQEFDVSYNIEKQSITISHYIHILDEFDNAFKEYRQMEREFRTQLSKSEPKANKLKKKSKLFVFYHLSSRTLTKFSERDSGIMQKWKHNLAFMISLRKKKGVQVVMFIPPDVKTALATKAQAALGTNDPVLVYSENWQGKYAQPDSVQVVSEDGKIIAQSRINGNWETQLSQPIKAYLETEKKLQSMFQKQTNR